MCRHSTFSPAAVRAELMLSLAQQGTVAHACEAPLTPTCLQLLGNWVFLRPQLNTVRALRKSKPQEAAAAERALAACAAQEQQGQPPVGLVSRSPCRRRSSSRGAEGGRRSRSRGRRSSSRGAEGGRRSRSRSRRRIGSRGAERQNGLGSGSRGRKRSRSRGDGEQRQRQSRRRSGSGELATPRELATPERSPSPDDAAEQPGRGASQTPDRSPPLEWQLPPAGTAISP